ncbi:MAG: sialate O-acetylesterase [Ginsengibacter sp.]
MKNIFSIVAIMLLANVNACATIRLPKIFGDSMVLQRGVAIPVWGWADKNEKILVSFNNQQKQAKAGSDGRWKVNLDAEKEGGPYILSIQGGNTIVIKDVLVGEVWICSGQSNMEFTVDEARNAAAEMAEASYPAIRHVKIANATSDKPLEDVSKTTGWQTATGANIARFTAVGYFFARELYNQLHVPIGLINTTWGGTDVETWTSKEAMLGSDEFKEMIGKFKTLNMDSISKIRKELLIKNIQNAQGNFVNNTPDESWKELSFDDSQWPQMKLPGLWEEQGLNDLDGVVWFRKTLEVPAGDAGKAAEISLAMIDDNDESYVNGIKIGSTKGYNIIRRYQIPGGVLKEGKNVISVRVEDTGGGGGIWGDSADLTITIDKKVQSLKGSWAFQVQSVLNNGSSVDPNSFPSLLYNAMINPLVHFAIKGAIWYQGEANAPRAFQYRKAFPLMITGWRQQWKEGDFPFYFVQLAGFNSGNGNSKNGSTWAELREAQALTLSLPNTGMAVTSDIGEEKDIHPKNKQDVGKRLAAVALNKTYGKENVHNGPQYQSMKVDGNKVILSFNKNGGDLFAKDPYGYLKGFEVAGADKQFYYARAFIQGENVVLFCDSVPQPVAVHYAWADYPGDANLYNKQGFPAEPFRTDTWKGITEGEKYAIGQ